MCAEEENLILYNLYGKPLLACLLKALKVPHTSLKWLRDPTQALIYIYIYISA